MTAKTFEDWARFMHDTYERLAPSFGYTTRLGTRVFDPESDNGRLMIATVTELLTASRAAILADRPDVAGLVEKLRDKDRRGWNDHDAAADALESLAAQLAQRDEEIAKLKALAGGLALEMELLLDFVRGYQGCKFIAANAALAEYRAAYPKDAP